MVRKNPEGDNAKEGESGEEVEFNSEGLESRLPMDMFWKIDVKSNQ